MPVGWRVTNRTAAPLGSPAEPAHAQGIDHKGARHLRANRKANGRATAGHWPAVDHIGSPPKNFDFRRAIGFGGMSKMPLEIGKPLLAPQGTQVRVRMKARTMVARRLDRSVVAPE